MSRILYLINMGLRYGRSKGVREYRLEEPPLGSLAVPCHLEESASHHMDFLDDPATIHGCKLIISCTTQDASPKEHMHPEISMKNHQKIYIVSP